MTDDEVLSEQAHNLRKRAEEIARSNAAGLPENLEALTAEQTRQLLHDLRVHQIELEMQNEELRRTQVELEDSRARYFDLYELAPVGYVTISEKGLVTRANLTIANLLDIARSALVKQPLSRFIVSEDQDIFYRHRRLLFESGEPQACELRMLRRDGAWFWAYLEASLMKEEDGKRVCRAVVSDITKRKRAEETLRENEKRFRTLFEQAAVGVALVETRTGRYIDTNQKYCDFLGYTRDEMLHLSFQAVTYPADVQENVDNNALLMEGKIREFSIEKRYIRKDGSLMWGVLTVSPLWVPGEVPAEYFHIAVVNDITERKQADEALQDARQKLELALGREQLLARTDSLTGLYNRRYFFELAAREFNATRRYRRPLAIIMFDTDSLKTTNDTFGHAAGDRLLELVAHTAAGHMRAVDVLARYGGDEFIIMLPETSTQHALPIAERIRSSVAALQVETGKGPARVTISIGIAELKSDPADHSIEKVIQRADNAMYVAKAQGRNRIETYPKA
jgi:diguanylate cyclase (GGDEF)-like protein/PAS domain S-box-containing protein